MNERTYEPMDIANYLVLLSQKKNKIITNLQLQKILFFVNAKHLMDHNGQSLMNENFQRWTYGPVMRSVYSNFRGFGSDSIPDTQGKYVFDSSDPFNAKYEPFNEEAVDDDVKEECAVVFNKLIDKNPFELVEYTHFEGLWSKYKEEIDKHEAPEYNDQEIYQYFSQHPKEKIWE